jgi:hypothetical protein
MLDFPVYDQPTVEDLTLEIDDGVYDPDGDRALGLLDELDDAMVSRNPSDELEEQTSEMNNSYLIGASRRWNLIDDEMDEGGNAERLTELSVEEIKELGLASELPKQRRREEVCY